MTKEQQIQIAVCESIGWKRISIVNGIVKGIAPEGMESYKDLPNVTTSLDACKETFEKDARSAYWGCLFTILGGFGGGLNFEMMKKMLTASPLQRCEAWLKFNQLWKDEWK